LFDLKTTWCPTLNGAGIIALNEEPVWVVTVAKYDKKNDSTVVLSDVSHFAGDRTSNLDI
jgi:hypothetical protein